MNDLGRRYWVAKENGSPRLVAGFLVAAMVCLLWGSVMRWGFALGTGIALCLIVLIMLPAQLRRRKS
jgi:ABC-type transport system involved in cytochrome bd biosynthesis fused ATPase/permease subunit